MYTLCSITDELIHSLDKLNTYIHLNKQWFDFREGFEDKKVSLFILEESLLEKRGDCFKQELTVLIEGYMLSKKDEDIYKLNGTKISTQSN